MSKTLGIVMLKWRLLLWKIPPLHSLGVGLRSILFSMMDIHEYMVTCEIRSEISWSAWLLPWKIPPLHSLGVGLRSILFSMMDIHEYMVTSEIHAEISWSAYRIGQFGR